MIQIFKIQLLEMFNYSIWWNTKMLKLNWTAVAIIEQVFNLAIRNDFEKKIELKKSYLGTNTQISKLL